MCVCVCVCVDLSYNYAEYTLILLTYHVSVDMSILETRSYSK